MNIEPVVTISFFKKLLDEGKEIVCFGRPSDR